MDQAGKVKQKPGDRCGVGDTDKDKWEEMLLVFLGTTTGRRKAIRLRLALNNHREGKRKTAGPWLESHLRLFPKAHWEMPTRGSLPMAAFEQDSSRIPLTFLSHLHHSCCK